MCDPRSRTPQRRVCGTLRSCGIGAEESERPNARHSALPRIIQRPPAYRDSHATRTAPRFGHARRALPLCARKLQRIASDAKSDSRSLPNDLGYFRGRAIGSRRPRVAIECETSRTVIRTTVRTQRRRRVETGVQRRVPGGSADTRPQRLLRSVGDSPSACAAVCGQGCSLGESSPKVILTKTKSHEAVGNRFS